MPSAPAVNLPTSPRKSKVFADDIARKGDMSIPEYSLFENDSKAIVWGQQIKAVQVAAVFNMFLFSRIFATSNTKHIKIAFISEKRNLCKLSFPDRSVF